MIVSLLRRRKTFLVLFCIVAIIALSLAYIFFWSGGPKDPSETFQEEYGLVLHDYEGKEVHLSDYKRNVLIAYAWASWCTYCGDEFQNLSKLKSEYGDKITIIAVNRAEPLPVAKEFTDALVGIAGVQYLIDPDDSFFKSVGGYAMPETIFIENGGDVFFQQRGPMKYEDAKSKIDEMLK